MICCPGVGGPGQAASPRALPSQKSGAMKADKAGRVGGLGPSSLSLPTEGTGSLEGPRVRGAHSCTPSSVNATCIVALASAGSESERRWRDAGHPWARQRATRFKGQKVISLESPLSERNRV